MSPDIVGLFLLASIFVFIFLGFPIAFTLFILSMIIGYFSLGPMVFHLLMLQTFDTMNNQLFSAITLFLLMGYLLEKAGLLERLFTALLQLSGNLRGSLYLTTILTATLFAAATGIVGAAVTIVGLMAAPSMIKAGYSNRLSAGTIAASGTLGILIPPSVMLVVMAPMLHVSTVKLFEAAILPGLLLSFVMIVYTMVSSYIWPDLGPAMVLDDRPPMRTILFNIILGFIPPFALIVSVLGSIIFGLATPTEAAACGVAGAFLIVVLNRKLTLPLLHTALLRTGQSAAMVIFLIAAANCFGAVFSRLGTPTLIANVLLSLELHPNAFLIGILVLIFILGWPMGEWVPIVVIVLPIFVPLLRELNVNMLWFGVLASVTMLTAWLTPPVALSAYFLKAVAPSYDLYDIYRGMLPFMILMLFVVVILMLFPGIVLFLPSIM